MTRRRALLWAGQTALAIALGFFVWRSLSGRWNEFQALDLSIRPRPGPLLLAAAAVLGTYALLIGAWRRLILGWGGVLTYRTAARIWCVSNLGRYVPGKVWSVAGLAVLAQRAGVPGWSAVGAAVAMQGLAVGTGAVIVALAAPGLTSAVELTVAVVLSAAMVAVLVWAPKGRTLLSRLVPAVRLPALPLGIALEATGVTLASWLAYGTAFWLLAASLLPVPLPAALAVGAFAAAYLLGLLALFAPGGVGVREAVLLALLAPAVGGGPAVILTVASRLLLTVTEAGAALTAALLDRARTTGADG